MRLIPLEQWFCDMCNGVIESPEDGWLEWQLDDEGLAWNFKIVHSVQSSPKKFRDLGCGFHGTPSLPLKVLAGDPSFHTLLNFLDLGDAVEERYKGPRVKSLREFTDLYRRLYVPHYEQAKHCVPYAKDEDFLHDQQDGWTRKENLLNLIDRYGHLI
jgi:hypothetical protein